MLLDPRVLHGRRAHARKVPWNALARAAKQRQGFDMMCAGEEIPGDRTLEPVAIERLEVTRERTRAAGKVSDSRGASPVRQEAGDLGLKSGPRRIGKD